MKREILYLNAESFTSMSACVREVTAILEATVCTYPGCIPEKCPACKIVIRANPKQREELESELEPIKQQWRVKVEDQIVQEVERQELPR